MVAAAGHGDVGRGGAGGLADSRWAVDGLALGAVDGGGVGELDVLARRTSAGRVRSPRARDAEACRRVDAGDGPGVAVGDPEVAVVAAGGDPVADPDPLPGGGDHGACRVRRGRPAAEAMVADGGVERRDLSRVSAMTETRRPAGEGGACARPRWRGRRSRRG